MRTNKIWARLLVVEGCIVEDVALLEGEGGEQLVVRGRLRPDERGRCSVCRRRCPGYDAGVGRRRWRCLDLGTLKAFVEAEAPRVTCPAHGVVVAAVPWARRASLFTRAFEDTLAWLAARTDKTTVSTSMRISWRTVGSIIERVVAEQRKQRSPFQGVTRIGVDEVSYRRGHRYLTVVVDHDSGRLLFAHQGRGEAAIDAFFDALGEDGCAGLQLVTADASPIYNAVIRRRCKNASVVMDPFHVVKWATDALDKVRRQVWNDARKNGLDADAIKGTRYALLKNPGNLNDKQKNTLDVVEKTNLPLFRAYLLKEHLREVFVLKGHAGATLLKTWLEWTQHEDIKPFRDVAKSILNNADAIGAALRLGLSNARVEALNTRMQLLTRVAFGFHSAKALIALAMLKLGGYCPALPCRTTHSPVS